MAPHTQERIRNISEARKRQEARKVELRPGEELLRADGSILVGTPRGIIEIPYSEWWPGHVLMSREDRELLMSSPQYIEKHLWRRERREGAAQ